MPKQQVVSYIDEYDVFRVKCLLHADIKRNIGTVIIGGEESSWTLAGALDYLLICKGAIMRASRQQRKRRAAAKLLVFCTELDVLRALIKDKLGEFREIGSKVKYCKRYCNYIASTDILFANANIICNNPPQKVHEMIGAQSVAQSVAQMLDSMQEDWTRIRWSLAHHTQSVFYKSIAMDLWDELIDKESAYYYSKESYDDMLIGNKSGALARFDSDGGRYQRQVLTNIISIDKRSAYPSVMVSDPVFPLRMIERVKDARVEQIMECITQHRWCKLVIDHSVGWSDDLGIWYDDDADALGFDIYDLLLCIRMHKTLTLIDALKHNTWRLYISTQRCWADSDLNAYDAVYDVSDGYLNTAFRSAIIDRYDAKEELPRESPDRQLAKTQIDMICGKGMQRISCTGTKSLNLALRGRADRYIRPQHSMHTIAAVRLELYTLIDKIISAAGAKAVIAFDTDGIKVKDSKAVRAILDAHNADIMQRNAAAGFRSDIGTWCIEYRASRFLQIGTKQYVYIDSSTGELVTKSAGIPKLDLLHAIRGLHMEPKQAIEYISQHKIPVERRAGFVYDPETQTFIEQRETVMF